MIRKPAVGRRGLSIRSGRGSLASRPFSSCSAATVLPWCFSRPHRSCETH